MLLRYQPEYVTIPNETNEVVHKYYIKSYAKEIQQNSDP